MIALEGSVNPLLRFLAGRDDVVDLLLSPPRLEDIFLGYYDRVGVGRRKSGSHFPTDRLADSTTSVGSGAAVSAIPRMTGRVLRNGLPGLVALLVGIALFEFVQPLVIASFGGARGLDAIMERIPPALQAFTRTRPEFLALSGLAGYLSLGFTHPLYIVLAGAAVIGFAARSLAGEMDRGIIQIPLSRRDLAPGRLCVAPAGGCGHLHPADHCRTARHGGRDALLATGGGVRLRASRRGRPQRSWPSSGRSAGCRSGGAP